MVMKESERAVVLAKAKPFTVRSSPLIRTFQKVSQQ